MREEELRFIGVGGAIKASPIKGTAMPVSDLDSVLPSSFFVLPSVCYSRCLFEGATMSFGGTPSV